MSFESEFGAALDRQLKRRELTQSELSRRLGVSRAYTNQLVAGRAPVSPKVIDRIATSIGIDENETAELHEAAARDRGYRIPKRW